MRSFYVAVASVMLCVAGCGGAADSTPPTTSPTVAGQSLASLAATVIAPVDEPAPIGSATTSTTPASTSTTVPSSPTTSTTVAAVPSTVPPAPTTVPAPVFEDGCDGNVWGPAFARTGLTAQDLGVVSCTVVPSGALRRPEGPVCGLFRTAQRDLQVEARTLEGGCRTAAASSVLIHEIGHAWHMSTPELAAWAAQAGMERVADCFAARFGEPKPCSPQLAAELTARL